MPLCSTPSRSYVLALTLIICLLASGCTTESPVPTPTAVTTAAPIFASEEEALAAAGNAYGAFLEVLDDVFEDGGVEPDRLLAVSTPAVTRNERVGLDMFDKKGWRSSGSTAFYNLKLQRLNATSRTKTVVVFVCMDLRGVETIDGSGEVVRGPHNVDVAPMVVSFDIAPESKSTLVVSEHAPWNGATFC